MFTETTPLMPMSSFMPTLEMQKSVSLPVSTVAKHYNAALDCFFYDVSSLTTAEYFALVQETNIEGSILVVLPRDPSGKGRVRKFGDHAALRAAPGRLLQRFTIAGVGSSDIGAAAFARTVADYYDEPVGAIVAGYGMADVLLEAMGGWFVLGMSNRLMKLSQDRKATMTDVLDQLGKSIPNLDFQHASAAAERVMGSPDSETLLSLLLDEDRTITSIIGHSKGCLSMAFALQALAVSGAKAALAKAKQIQCITTGTVVEFPEGFRKVAQFLGNLDQFGRMNSRKGIAYEPVPNAWHHLNTTMPFHMNLREILDRV